MPTFWISSAGDWLWPWETYGQPPDQADRYTGDYCRPGPRTRGRDDDRNRGLHLRRPQPQDDCQREPGIDARAEPAYRLRCSLRVGHDVDDRAVRLVDQAHADPARRCSL